MDAPDDLDRRMREFARRTGRDPEVAALAPGRVNLIGEHTDYNEGLVLPCAIDRRTLVLAARRPDPRVRVFSAEMEASREWPAEAPGTSERAGDWSDYVRGVLWALGEQGVAPGGLDLAVASRVPPGSGLSSSAALEVAVAAAVDVLLGAGLGPRGWAEVAHRAETAFVGVACGIMDSHASALGREGCALRLDCRSGRSEPVPLPEGLALLLADSGGRRELAAGAYGRRREECARAVAAARRAGLLPPDAGALRDLGAGDLPALERVCGGPAGDAVAFRRARHVVTENARVEAFCRALGAGDPARAGAILRQGMDSLREDFEVSTPELDLLCEVADALPGVHGSRLTGAGLGGWTLHLVDAAAARDAAAAIADEVARRSGRRPAVERVAPGPGARARLHPRRGAGV